MEYHFNVNDLEFLNLTREVIEKSKSVPQLMPGLAPIDERDAEARFHRTVEIIERVLEFAFRSKDEKEKASVFWIDDFSVERHALIPRLKEYWAAKIAAEANVDGLYENGMLISRIAHFRRTTGKTEDLLTFDTMKPVTIHPSSRYEVKLKSTKNYLITITRCKHISVTAVVVHAEDCVKTA